MRIHGRFDFRWWVEFFAWVGLTGLFVVIQLLPIPADQRVSTNVGLLVLGLYAIICFHILFPLSHYAPRIIYLTLIVDIFLVGVFRFLLAPYLPDVELGFIPIILMAAMVADRRGVMTLAIAAILIDLVSRLAIAPLTLSVILNEFVLALAFVVLGLSLSYFARTLRTRTTELEQLRARFGESELAARGRAEHSLQRWQFLNDVTIRVQQETGPERIYQVVADELHALGLDYYVSLWRDPGRVVNIEYLSLPAAALELLKQVVGTSYSDFDLDISGLSIYQDCLVNRRGVLITATPELIKPALPMVPDALLERIIDLAGLDRCIIAPLIAGDQVTGFFQVWGHALSVADIPALTGLAQQIAIALDKARLLERERKRAAQLAFVSEIAERAVGLLDADELLEQVTRLMVARFQFENVAIFMNDPPRREVVLAAQDGRNIDPSEAGYRQSWDVGLLGHAVRQGITVVANDVRADPRYYSNHADDICRAELIVPLKSRYQVIGALDVQSTTVNAFDPTDVIALETLAAQLAAAVEKSEMFARERKRAAQLSMVSAIAESATATLDPDRLLREVSRLICERFGYYYVSVMLLDPATEELEMHASYGGYQELFPAQYHQKASLGLIGQAAQSGRTVVCNDVSRDSVFYFPQGHTPAALSEMCVPLKVGARTLGVFDVHSLPAHAFDVSDLAAMETLANQIAVALENARWYAQARGETEVKAALLRELSHRVKNNLASIVGLLYLGIEDPAVPREQILDETLTRVQSMMVAHTMLASSEDARVDLPTLCSEVIRESVRHLALPGQDVNWDVSGDRVQVTAQQASSLALVLNELVTNAIKHGGNGPRELGLVITRVGAQAQLEWTSCIPDPATLERALASNGLGEELVRTLVEKDLHGSLQVESRPRLPGVASIICFEPGQ